MTYYSLTTHEQRRRSKLALITALLAFVVILLGAYTRLTDAGLSCPDWPHCFGYLTAPHTTAQIEHAAKQFPTTAVNVKKAWTEMTHRYFAGAEGILILFLVGSLLTNRKNHFISPAVSFSLLVLLLIQVMLGMLTVTAKLKPIIVLAHLLTGLSILSLLWCIYLNRPTSQLSRNPYLFRSSAAKNVKLILPWLWAAFVIVFMQIALGGWVSSHYAGLACIDFPYCNNVLLPTLKWANLNTDLITIHMLHRLGAAITAGYCLFLAIFLIRKKFLTLFAYLFILLITLQLSLGIFNIIWLRPTWIALSHHAIAILLLLTTVTALIYAYSGKE